MLVVKNIRVDAYVRGTFDVSWEIEDTTEIVGEYAFYVLRSGGPVGPFDPVSPPLEDLYQYTDSQVRRSSLSKPFYYKIRVVKGGDTADYPENEGVSVAFEGDLIAKEMVRRTWLKLARKDASIIVLPKRRFGTKCPYCVSSGVRRRSRCPSCFDTGYLGGFLKPYEVPADETAEDQKMLATKRGPSDGKQKEFEVPPSPKAYQGDMVVDQAGQRWEVVRSLIETHTQRAVLQRILVDSIELGDSRYGVSVDVQTARINTFHRLRRRADV